MKKSFKIIAQAILNGQIGKVELPTESLDAKKLAKETISEIVKEEFGKVKDLNKMKLPKEVQFAHADLAKEIDWADELDLKEFLIKK